MIMRIPRTVMLPFGYKIQVRQVTQGELARVIGGGSNVDGGWRVDLRTLYLLRSLDKVAKLRTFTHELDHALNDWTLWVMLESEPKETK